MIEKGKCDLLQCLTKESRKDIVRYCYEASLGLKHMHDKGYAHRDIKPKNIVICEAYHPVKHCVAKLIDYGLVKKYERSDKIV